MDFDDGAPARQKPLLDQLEKEDLSAYSVEDLDDRLARLAAEIERTKADKVKKTASMSAADALFRS